ncbi:MAG: hypothetical protein JJE21_04265 [Spirochaetaceae bacterium]|nr:hypothetical protein [Spirochaetaceae bacterium]
MKFLLFAQNLEILNICYDEGFLANGIYKSREQIIKDSVIYDDIEYAFGTWGVPFFSEAEIRKYFPSLKAFFYGAGSVQYFARPFFNCGVRVFSSWCANAIPVSEYTVAQIILANKGYFKFQNTYRESSFYEARAVSNHFPGNFKTKVGLLGAGMIGRLVINLLKNYEIELLVFDPFMSEEKAKELGVIKADLDTIFSECQTISNHLAQNKNTNGILNYNHFSKMSDYTTFINTARGSIVNEEDLKRVMRENNTLTAILDVIDPDEYRPNTDDLFSVENIIVTPHSAGSQTKERQRLGQFMIEEYKAYIINDKLKYEVHLKDLETMA